MNGLRPAVEGTQVLPPSVERRIELELNAARLVQPEKGILAAGPKMPLLALPHHLPTRSFGPLPAEDAGRQILDSLRGHSQSVGQLNQVRVWRTFSLAVSPGATAPSATAADDLSPKRDQGVTGYLRPIAAQRTPCCTSLRIV